MSRQPSLATRRPRRRRGGLFGALLVGISLVVLGAPVRPAAAAESVASALDRPLVDAAFVERGPGLTPDVLAVEVNMDDPSDVRLALLRRDATWTEVADEALSLLETEGSYPWLLSMGEARYALLSITGRQTTALYVITIDTDEPAIRVGAPTEVELAATGGGMADVVGSADPEIILAGRPVVDEGCGAALLAVLDGAEPFETIVNGEIVLPGGDPLTQLAGASFGHWDEDPGIDLLIHGTEPCPIDENTTEHRHLAVVHLTDLQVVADITEPEPSISSSLPAPPIALDVDGDGRDEALIDSDEGPFLLDPADGWRHQPVGPPGALVVATAARSAGPGAVVTTMRWSEDVSTATGVATATVARVDGRLTVAEDALRPIPGATVDVVRPAWVGTQILGYSQQRHASFVTDLDGDGCPDVVAPVVTIACRGTGAVAAGPPWMGTRPLLEIGTGPDRRLLVATTVDWYPFEGGPVPSSPDAGHEAGDWRSMGGSRFVLGEAPLPLLDAAPAAVEGPTIGRTVSKDGVVELRWPAESRLMLRIRPVTGITDVGLTTSLGSQADFLYAEPLQDEYIGFLAAPGLGLANGTYVSIPEPDIARDGDTNTWRMPLLSTMQTSVQGRDRWYVVAAALDPTGSVSDPVAAMATVDTTPPEVQITPPMVSAPWPFGTTIVGTAEPGSSVSLPGSKPVVVGADGSFVLPAQLAPWPQTLKATAIDEAGNERVASASVMGGIDIRGLPWPAIGVVAVLAGALLTSLRGVRGGQRVRPIAASFDEVATPEIEELPGRPGPGD